MFTLGIKGEPVSVPGDDIAGNQSERLTRRVWSGFAKSLITVVALVIGCSFTSLYYTHSSALVAQSHQMLERLSELRFAMAALDGATARILIRSDAEGLAAREVAQQRALTDLKLLHDLARDGRGHLPAFDSAAMAVQAQIAIDNDIVAAYQARGAQAAMEVLRSEKSRHASQALATNLDRAESASYDLLSSCNSAEQWLGRINLIVIVVGCAMALAAIGSAGSAIKAALAMLQTRVADQRSALEHLRSLNETLEERVAERSTAAEQRALALAQAQNTLYRQTRLLRSLLTSMTDAVMVCDKQKKLLEINPAAERILGRELRTLPLDQWATHFELLTETGGKPIGRADWPLIRAARGEELKTTWLLRQGRENRWIEGSAAPIRDDNGSILGAAMVFRDITDRRLVAEELREALEEGDRVRALLAAEKQRNAA